MLHIPKNPPRAPSLRCARAWKYPHQGTSDARQQHLDVRAFGRALAVPSSFTCLDYIYPMQLRWRVPRTLYRSLDHQANLSPYPSVLGIHHSLPRAVVTYSGHRRLTGGLKSWGSNGATHFSPPIPPPVRASNSFLASLRISGFNIRSTKVAAMVLPATIQVGSIVGG